MNDYRRKKKKRERLISPHPPSMIGVGIEKYWAFVGVSRRLELFNAASGINIFNDVAVG